MPLTDKQIKIAIDMGEIFVEPSISDMDMETRLGSVSLDLSLGREIVVVGKTDDEDERIVMTEFGYILSPGEFILASTEEIVTLPGNILGRLEGRSSIARLGLTVHVTAGIIDPGFSGRITLEIANLGPKSITLYPGMRICAISFDRLDFFVDRPYGQKKSAKYQYQRGPITGMIDNV